MADLLLVDNDERITKLVAWFLERGGHAVRIAPSYARARECIAEHWPELLLADLELGLERGDEELTKLAREGRMPPTLVVSGYLDAELEARLRLLPALVGTLAKPFDLAQLMERVEAGLRAAASAPPASARPAAAEPWDEDDDEAWIRITPARGSGE